MVGLHARCLVLARARDAVPDVVGVPWLLLFAVSLRDDVKSVSVATRLRVHAIAAAWFAAALAHGTAISLPAAALRRSSACGRSISTTSWTAATASRSRCRSSASWRTRRCSRERRAERDAAALAAACIPVLA
jgi:hypothetical protein